MPSGRMSTPSGFCFNSMGALFRPLTRKSLSGLVGGHLLSGSLSMPGFFDFRKIKVGHPLAQDTLMGPLVSEAL